MNQERDRAQRRNKKFSARFILGNFQDVTRAAAGRRRGSRESTRAAAAAFVCVLQVDAVLLPPLRQVVAVDLVLRRIAARFGY